VRRIIADGDALRAHRELNQTTVPFPEHSSVKELFESCVNRWPDAPAVVHAGGSLSYRELNQHANALAVRLRRHGLGLGDVVGVCVDRSPALVIALLAILKCGSTYLPFDSHWPDERLTGLFDDAHCRALVSDRTDVLAARFVDRRVLAVDQAGPPADAGNPDLVVPSTAVAYINFTSGSAGWPKGVPIRHRSIARLVFGARYAQLDQRTTLLQLAPVTFDAATFELWGALLHGGTCVLYPARFVRLSELKRVLETHSVSVLFLTTALFNTVVDEAPETIDRVPTILIGGEAQSIKHVRRALDRYGPDRLVNAYGPTECTTFATYYPIKTVSPDDTALPIGRPIQNTRVYVVDGDRLCAPGETGEIMLAGPGLSPGYLGLNDATSDRFGEYDIDGKVERLYRTGDRAYLRLDGELVFQGRLDSQVKINGYRIELGEVSHHLDLHPLVRQSYVTVAENAAGERSLVAFIVPEDGSCTQAAIRDFLGARLPAYMVPAAVNLRHSLPLSATGKVDRGALLSEQPPGTVSIE
jgi:amino acid adenylation domain-containing protein